MTLKVKQKEDYADRATPVVESKVTDNVAEDAEKPYSEKDTKFINITADITSGFMFYPYNTLSIRPFTLGCLRKIFRAVSQHKLSHMVEVISFSIDPDKSAMDLTAQDFWSLMFWERINSYKKAPYRVTFNCLDNGHKAKVASGELAPDTLANEIVVKNTGELEVKHLDKVAVSEWIKKVQEEYNISLYPARASDLVELEELQEKMELDEDKEEIAWIAQLASNLSKAHGQTLAERIDFLTKEELSPDLKNDIEKFIELADHGIRETLTVKCAGCGVSRKEELSFDVLSFFPVGD